MMKPKGPNPLAHLLYREVGENVENFQQNLFRERLKVAKNLYKNDLISHFGCVNAIEFSKEGEFLASGGDDRRVLLWHLETCMAGKRSPVVMKNIHLSNVFCLGFNSDNSRLFSGGNDNTVIVHDVQNGETVDVFTHTKPVYGLSIDSTNEQIFSSACEDGRILIFDLRLSAEVLCIAKYRAPFHAVMFHPLDGSFLVTGNAKEGAALWDLRRPKTPFIRYGLREDAAQSCMSVRFNTLGSQVLALRRRLPPILYNTTTQEPICQFYHPDYYNSCTMKSCCFAGEKDEYVLSGSDDFSLYMWRISDADCDKTDQWIDTNQLVLYGHRSIVNQVRYNPQKCLIASSGVEKVVKLWSPFQISGWTGGLTEEANGPEDPRGVYTHDEYLSLVHVNGQNMTHDYSNQNTLEDPVMMALFDSLVQQEIEGWNSTDSSDSHQQTEYSLDNSSRPTSTQSSDSESNNFTSQRDIFRHRSTNNIIKPQRSIYPNRIAYLIATKRNTLKRLALKGAAHTSRRIKTSKFGMRKHKRTGLRTTRKGTGKRAGRVHNKKIMHRRSSRDMTSDTEGPKKLTKRRIQQHLNTSSYRSFRRKFKVSLPHRYAEESDTSSDNDSGSQLDLPSQYNLYSQYNKGNSSDSKNNDEPGTAMPSNYRSETSTSADLAVPSTSTGITANGKGLMFRLTQEQVDSDDDQSVQASPPPLQPTRSDVTRFVSLPVNGVTKSVEDRNNRYSDDDNSNDDNDDNDDNQNDNIDHIRRNNNKRTFHNPDIYSSHSNSRLSNSSYQNDSSSSNDSLMVYFNKKRKICNRNDVTPTTPQNGESSKTQLNGRDILNFTPDSGIATTVCSSAGSITVGGPSSRCYEEFGNMMPSSSSASIQNGSGNHILHPTQDSNNNGNLITTNGTNGDNVSLKLFQQKVARVRRNYRQHFGDDSDSD